MSVIFENARLTNDSSEQTYAVYISDGIVKSIVPSSTTHTEAASSPSDSDAERIDLRGQYVGMSQLLSLPQ